MSGARCKRKYLNIERMLCKESGSLFGGDSVIEHRVGDLVARVRIVLNTMDDPVVRKFFWRFTLPAILISFGRSTGRTTEVVRRGHKKGNYRGKSLENDRKSWRQHHLELPSVTSPGSRSRLRAGSTISRSQRRML